MPLNGSKIDVAVGGRAGRAEGMRHSVSSDAMSALSIRLPPPPTPPTPLIPLSLWRGGGTVMRRGSLENSIEII